MLFALIEKLESFEALPEAAKERLRRLPARLMRFGPREAVVREAEPRGDVHIMVEGIAARTKALDAGREAIIGFLLPGEVDEADPFTGTLDHGIAAITPCKVAQISGVLFEGVLVDFPELARGLRHLARLEQAIGRVWLANMGGRMADRQTAHLLCELQVRLQAAGMGGPDWFANPFTQEHLANVLGISSVHMNRVMHHLRDLGLIRLDGHVLRFPSLKKIHEYAGFDAAYLAAGGGAHRRAGEAQPLSAQA